MTLQELEEFHDWVCSSRISIDGELRRLIYCDYINLPSYICVQDDPFIISINRTISLEDAKEKVRTHINIVEDVLY